MPEDEQLTDFMSGLQTVLLKTLSASGWRVCSDGIGVSAEREGFFKRWIFGQRSVKFRLELKLDEGSKTLLFCERAVEESTGWPPPMSRMRSEMGMPEFEMTRRWIQQQCGKLGWAFEMLAAGADSFKTHDMADAVRR